MTIDEILRGESKEIEYKEDVPSNSRKYTRTAAAYANCAGGRIVFGLEHGFVEFMEGYLHRRFGGEVEVMKEEKRFPGVVY